MNSFLDDFIDHLRVLNCPLDIPNLYHWLWANQDQIAATASQINASLRLSGPCCLQPDLPCVTVGSLTGLVVMAANPGWKKDFNRVENDFSKSSPDQYVQLMRDFFFMYPRVFIDDPQIGKRHHSRWWSRAINFIPLVSTSSDGNFGVKGNAQTRWDFAYRSQSLGGWDLLPWHSQKDGITAHIESGTHPWLKAFIGESVRALFRMRPKVVLVASKAGATLLTQLTKELELPVVSGWQQTRIGKRRGVHIAIAKLDSGGEIVCLNRQLFANVFRDFTDSDVMNAIEKLRHQDTTDRPPLS